ncbi:hypothetical protein DCAR_0832607 [Daucus carota subsp. sativus]|uniref:protein-serine/threonine phosphatase n=1 Tax=Daucus carota subsp. sativus TaxID=79200 RepID=A0A175YR64_DAUCS|nr:PREDICTED: probable protein phosphatase 2C 13 [Daucus carota subsp. sativus]XP_017220468.1 PREDICTED: probable protein phosphatase 2C 13 [Daucus carota subsp. sativus]WOH13098.1 hypothetical protein DCAR_0832607 [Daucus carota subsp. sativus]
MVAEAKIICEQSASLAVSIRPDFFDLAAPSKAVVDICASEAVSAELTRSESVVRCSTTIQATSLEPAAASKYVPSIRSGSYTDIGPRRSNEDEHICVDDLSAQLGSCNMWPLPSSFYAVFDGHGGSEASAYVKNNAMQLFFGDAALPQIYDNDDKLLEDLGNSHQKAFLLADQALADECTVCDFCGTTALTALVFGSHLLVANAGDSRAVLCRKGVAVPMSQDHRPSCLPEQKRVKDLGGYIEDGYLNGELAVTRALGDWYMKSPSGSPAPLTAEPEVQQTLLTEDDEFLILGCDGIWDVMSNQEAVSLVRCTLRKHDDPQECAKALVDLALRKDTSDNLTAIVICFTSPVKHRESVPQRPKSRCLSLSEDARIRLMSLLQGN